MAYKKTRWRDHSVERPRTYTSITNQDGSRTDTPAFGTVIQQGTQQSATNFNHIEDGLSDVDVAFNLLYVLTQAEMRGYEARITTNEEALQVVSLT